MHTLKTNTGAVFGNPSKERGNVSYTPTIHTKEMRSRQNLPKESLLPRPTPLSLSYNSSEGILFPTYLESADLKSGTKRRHNETVQNNGKTSRKIDCAGPKKSFSSQIKGTAVFTDITTPARSPRTRSKRSDSVEVLERLEKLKLSRKSGDSKFFQPLFIKKPNDANLGFTAVKCKFTPSGYQQLNRQGLENSANELLLKKIRKMEARVRQLEEILAAKSIEKENIDDLATYISDGNTFDGFYNTEIFPPGTYNNERNFLLQRIKQIEDENTRLRRENSRLRNKESFNDIPESGFLYNRQTLSRPHTTLKGAKEIKVVKKLELFELKSKVFNFSEAISSQLNQSSPAFSVNFSHQTGLLNRRKPLLSEKFRSTLQKKFVDSFLELKAEIDNFYEGNILELQTIKHDNQSVCTSAAGYKNNCVQYVNPKASELSLMSEGFRSTTDMDTDESNSNNNTYSTFGSTLASSGPPVNHCIKCEYYLCSIKSLLIDNDFYREDNEKLKRRLENAIEDHNKLVDIFEDGKKLLLDPGIHSVVMS